MKPISILLLCAALALGLNADAGAAEPTLYKPSAQLTDKGDPAHLAAIKRMLRAMEMPTGIRAGMASIPKTERERHELGAHMARYVSDDDFCAVLAPSYLKYISADQADRLAIHYRTSIGRRRVIAMLSRDGAIKGERNPYFTNSEVREIQAIDALPGSRSLIKEHAQIQKANIAAMQAWGHEYHGHYLQLAKANLEEIVTAQRNYKPGDPGEQISIRRTGLPTLDQYVQIIAESSIAAVNASRSMQSDLKAYQLDRLLDSTRLVTAAGIARSRQTLTDSSERVERYLHESDLRQSAYRERISAAAPDKQSLASFEAGILRQYEQLVRIGENQRALIDVFGRILDFVESRLGRITANEKNLMFGSEEDARLYNALLDKVQVLATEEQQLNAESGRRK
jgi:hypothetical protein